MSANRESESPPGGGSGQPDLWDRLLSGELDPEDPEVARQLDSDPVLAEKWAQVQRLGGFFDRVAGEERRLLAVASEDPEGSGLNLDLSPPPELLGASPLPSPFALSRRLGSVLALAAAVLVAWFLLGQDRRAQDPLDLEALRGRILAESDFEVRLESGPEGSILRWDQDPELGWFDLVVYEVDPTIDPEALDQGPGLYRVNDLFHNELDLSSRAWPTTEKALWIRVNQRIEGVSGPWKTGGLLLPPGSLSSSH